MGLLTDSNKTYSDDQTATADIIALEGVQGSLIVGTSAIEVRVGASRLEGRKSLTLYNNSNSIIYWGFTSSVTISTGTPIERKQFIEWNVGDSVAIYVIAASAGNNARITEAS